MKPAGTETPKIDIAEVGHDSLKFIFQFRKTIDCDGVPFCCGLPDEAFVDDSGSSDWQFAFPAALDING